MHPERAAIERQLQAIFASADFVSAPKMRQLLRYLVDATLAGDAERLKGYAIGVDVFERGTGFDPAADPIVRVQAGRLRKLLDSYYRTDGAQDPIRIAIPKGGYAVTLAAPGDGGDMAAEPLLSEGSDLEDDDARGPFGGGRSVGHLPLLLLITLAGLALVIFGVRSFNGNAPSAPPPATTDATVPDAITLAVLPFTDMSKGGANAPFADGLADALTTALARVKSLAVVSRTSAFQYRDAADLRRVGRELGVRHVLEGGLQHDGSRMRINVQLIDALSGAHVWAQHYDRPTGDDLAVQTELVTTLAAEIRPQIVNAAKRALDIRPAQPATAWQLYLQSTWMPGAGRNSLAWEQERVRLARMALKRDPNLGQADSVLADKLAYLANVDPSSDSAEARAEAALHARRALELAPDDADVMFNVSIHYWHAGQIKESLDATRRTLELDPNHGLARFLVMAVPFTCSVAPQTVIDELVAFDAAVSPDNPIRWLTLYWISRLYLNNNNLEEARDAARRSDQIFRSPDSFFQLAAILVQRGEAQEAVRQIDAQRESWPSLDPRHYADVAIPRRCGGEPAGAFLRRIYGALADAVDAARQAANRQP